MGTVDAPGGTNREMVIFDAKEVVANTKEELAVENPIEDNGGLGIERNWVNAVVVTSEGGIKLGRKLATSEDTIGVELEIAM